jgi:AmpD protein
LLPELVVVHCVSLPEGEYGTGAPQRLFTGVLDCEEHSSFADLEGLKVAPHVLIDRLGQIEQFVGFDKRAWHAGVSTWRGRNSCNDFSIGVELEGSVQDDYTVDQYRTLIQLVITLMGAYPQISADAVVGHCDIAPVRKTDPGPRFDWLRVITQVHQKIETLC